jgi:hypothetical protein
MTDPEPVEAIRAAPGEYFLAAETVHIGLRFRAGGAVYEITSEPRKWGISWVADLTVIEGFKPGSTVHRAMLHTGRKMNP